MAYASNDGVKLYWEEHGQGPPVLLIMGLGYTLDMWHRLLPALSDRYRAIVFDNRGVGGSDVPPPPYSIPEMAGDAVAVLDAAGVQQAAVVGISMGGVIAQELALSHPGRVASLVLVSTACGGPDAVPAEAEVLRVLAARAEMSPEDGVRAMLPYIYDPETPAKRIDEDLAIRLRTFPSAEGYMGQLQAALGYETYARLDRIEVPTLVIHGRSDRLVPPGNGEDVASRIAGARLVMLDGASHILFTDRPQTSVATIRGFLDEVNEASEVAG